VKDLFKLEQVPKITTEITRKKIIYNEKRNLK